MVKIKHNQAIFWFRRDLRIDDNHGLYRALTENDEIIPLFIFDKRILGELTDSRDPRVTFIYRQVRDIKDRLRDVGSDLLVFHGDPEEIFKDLMSMYDFQKVYINRDYEPYAIERDKKVKQLLSRNGIELKTFKDQVIFEEDEILNKQGKPYTVYTPYMKRWKEQLQKHYPSSFIIHSLYDKFIKDQSYHLPALRDMGFEKSDRHFPDKTQDIDIIRGYHKNRDFPALNGTTRLSVHLRFGTISIRQLVIIAEQENEVFLNELIWREFYMMILWHFPHVVNYSFKKKYDFIQWRNNEKEFSLWCRGKTGIPVVDAGMRELNTTGYMHNRVRMITASFLSKHLLIDWRWGEAYFAEKLLDYELSSNNGGWQWAAGTGVDAAPYFRIFNPYVQAQKYDPDNSYIEKWVPELNTKHYPEPVVDLKISRQRALNEYKRALNKKI